MFSILQDRPSAFSTVRLTSLEKNCSDLCENVITDVSLDKKVRVELRKSSGSWIPPWRRSVLSECSCFISYAHTHTHTYTEHTQSMCVCVCVSVYQLSDETSESHISQPCGRMKLNKDTTALHRRGSWRMEMSESRNLDPSSVCSPANSPLVMTTGVLFPARSCNSYHG